MTNFGAKYAVAYDALYGNKNYSAECDRVIDQLQALGASGRRLLDLGCGTGGHAWELSTRGYEVVGVDISEPMLSKARSRSAPEGAAHPPRFVQADARTVDLGDKYDAVLMMFAVLGYQTTNADVLATFRAIRRHLEVGGVLVFDFWFGPAVLSQRPGDRVRVVDTEGGEILRVASSSLDVATSCCKVTFRLWQLAADRVLGRVSEDHLIRFFFEQELRLFLELSGFMLRRLGDFDDPEVAVSESTWNVLAVAEAV